MVSGSTTGGNLAAGIDDGVRRMIQSIKEIVGNHSDADIYAALKEANLDADETAQKLLNQDPFREVKRKRDRKKEETTFEGPVDRRVPSDNVIKEMKFRTQPGNNVRRGGYSRNTFPRNGLPCNAFLRNSATGTNKEFRVVRDNRSNMNANGELKHSTLRLPKSDIHKSDASVNKGSAVGSDNHQPSRDLHPIFISSTPADAQPSQTGGALSSGSSRKSCEEKQATHNAILESTNSVVGVYSSSTDPVNVPSPESRSSAIGAIRCEVMVEGYGGKPSENVVKDSSAHGESLSGTQSTKSGATQYRPFSPIPKIDQLNQTTVRESVMPGGVANRSFFNSQHNNRGSQYARTQQQASSHAKAVSQNREWKPKSSQKSGVNNPGVLGTPKESSAPPGKSLDLESKAVELQDKLSHVNIGEGQNVIIAEHIRVPETDRCRLTFGSFVLEHDSSCNSGPGFQEGGLSEECKHESMPTLPAAAPDERTDSAATGTKPVDVLDDEGKDLGSCSPVSTASEQQLPKQKEVSRCQNLDEYAGLLTGNGLPYDTSQSKQQQDHSELRNFSEYDHQTGYDLPYFRPAIDENARAQGLPSPQEQTLYMHTDNNIPASTVTMMQQQQAPMAQMHSQVHVAHFANLMPYRQILSPVYVPQMPMPGFPGNPATYPHPSNGNSYLLMPGGSSQFAANGMKYGIQQFKPVPSGSPVGFGSFNNPNGYPVNAPGIVGNATVLEDSSRMKFKDGSIYITNPQAETSEMWMQNPRDLPGPQPTPYYNVPGQPRGAYISSHTAHPSFNAAAAAAQSSHMQFQGLFHPPQPIAMPSPHHMGPGLGGSVGVGVAPSTPAAPAVTFQQPQLGHMNWPTNF